MRTKTLLIAAAALAATVISSEAQAVYSANVVGYVNQSLVTGFNLVVNPLNAGLTNGANEVFPNIPDSTALFLWNGTGYTIVYKDFSAPPAMYYMSDYSTPTNTPIITPGEGVFLQLPYNVTNTVVGTVNASVGGTATNSTVTGFNMIGSPIPYGGTITNSAFNFNPPDSTAIFMWNGNGYTVVYKDYSAPPDQFYMSDYSTPTNAPVLNVGSAVFFQLPSPWQWVQTLTNN